MLDRDLATLYKTETKRLTEAVKRNIKRFPPDFMFQLTAKEFDSLRSQFATSKRGGIRYLPYVFTEQGVAMLSGIINSDTAIKMNIAIMRAFVAIRNLSRQQMDLHEQLRRIKERLGEHDTQLNSIYDALENMLDEKAGSQDWEDRERIGFIIKVD